MKKINKLCILAFLGICAVIAFCITSNTKPSTKKVVLMTTSESWNGKGVGELYQAMKNAGHEVKIALYPFTYLGKVTIDIDRNFARKFDETELLYPCNQYPPYTTCDRVESGGFDGYKPDYIFIQNPYSPSMNESLKKITKKLMYVVYGPYIFHQKHGANPDLRLPELVDVVFTDSDVTNEIYIKDFKFASNQVVTSGYIGYQEMRQIKLRSKPHERETILWLPRWHLSFKYREYCEGGSTFLSYHYFFYNYAASHPDIHFIIRPHQALFNTTVQENYFSQNDIDDIFNRFRALPNVTISMHQSRSLAYDVDAADIVIADGTSALGEVVVDDKPIIYLSNGWNYEFTSNALSQALKKYVYLAYDPNDIIRYMDKIRISKYNTLGDVPCQALKCKLSNIQCKVFGEICSRDAFKKALDPVENPAKFIANYLLYDVLKQQ